MLPPWGGGGGGDTDSLKTVSCSSIEKTILVELYMISVSTVKETGLVVVLPIERAQAGYSCCLYDKCSKRGVKRSCIFTLSAKNIR